MWMMVTSCTPTVSVVLEERTPKLSQIALELASDRPVVAAAAAAVPEPP
jgi:hypothetical protein